jgi:hypothetical protein
MKLTITLGNSSLAPGLGRHSNEDNEEAGLHLDVILRTYLLGIPFSTLLLSLQFACAISLLFFFFFLFSFFFFHPLFPPPPLLPSHVGKVVADLLTIVEGAGEETSGVVTEIGIETKIEIEARTEDGVEIGRDAETIETVTEGEIGEELETEKRMITKTDHSTYTLSKNETKWM